jgi:hypothetical protein
MDRRKLKNPEKTCPSANLSTTNPTLTDAGTYLGLCGERPATNVACPYPSLRYNPDSCLEGLRKATKILSLDLNP